MTSISYAKIVRSGPEDEDVVDPSDNADNVDSVDNVDNVDNGSSETSDSNGAVEGTEPDDGFVRVPGKKESAKKSDGKAKRERRSKRTRGSKKDSIPGEDGCSTLDGAAAQPETTTPEDATEEGREDIKYVAAPLPKVNPWKNVKESCSKDENDPSLPTIEQSLTKGTPPEKKEEKAVDKKAPWKTAPPDGSRVSRE